MISKIIQSESIRGILEKLQSITENEFVPNLAIVFSSISKDLEEIRLVFNQLDIDLFGCSSSGEICNDTVYEGSIVCLLIETNKDFYSIETVEYIDNDVYSSSYQLGITAKNTFEKPALIVVSGGVFVDGEKVVEGLKGALGNNVPIFGGLAGDDLALIKTSVFDKKNVTSNGLTALIFDNDKIEINGVATSGWEPIGLPHTVTKAINNIIYTINHEPALDVFLKYFGYFDNNEVKGKRVSTISAQYPLQVIREDGSSVLRAPLLASEEERTLLLAGGIKEGDQFRFSISPGFEVIDQTVEEISQLAQPHREADALILFSCKGRHSVFGPMMQDEIQGIYHQWGKPMIGFFSYGEIGQTQGSSCDFHNETCSLVIIKEK